MADSPRPHAIFLWQMKRSGSAIIVELAWRLEDTMESWGMRFIHTLRERLPLLSATLYGMVDAEHLEQIVSYAPMGESLPIISQGEGIIGEAARLQKTFLYELIDPPMLMYGFGYIQPRFHWVFPWVYQGRTWAVIEALLHRSFSEAEEQWLNKNQNFIGMLLSNIFQQRRIERLLTEQQRQNALLQENLLRLEEAQSELNALNASLEERVRQRTEDLERALKELSSAQQQLVLSEKMAALGQLVAGVAHEINSPLGAIKGSAETLLEALPRLLSLLSHFGVENWQVIIPALVWLKDYLMQGQRPLLTSKEERALRKQYTARLEALGISDPETTARRIVEAGILTDDIVPLLPLLQTPEGIDLLYLLGQLRLQLENIVTAANRTRKTVFALKSYTHTTDHSRPTLTRLEESIETILTLYQNQLKQGVTVHTEYDPAIPPLYLFSDEVGQVWTNLIQNAIQAMQGQGNLSIEAKLKDDTIEVSFTDNGPGIPPEILPRIFEPFFTTKPKGEGTGLGLDICRRIIEKHRGRISVESRPGHTRFTVHLPLLLAEAGWYTHEPHPERI